MYRIIGGDGKEYGPVTAEQLQRWVTEGRVAADSRVKTEGSTEWKAFREHPELAAIPGIAQQTVPPRVYSSPSSPPGPKSKLAAGLLGIFLGGWGVHRFYLGYVEIGIVQIVVTLLTCGLGALWGFIEGILIIAGNTITTDSEGRPLQD